MKKVFLFSTLLLLFIYNCSYASYNGWNLLSTRRNLTSIVFISDSKGWIFGGDIAYKTINGGITWSYPIKMNYNVGISVSARPVFFIDSLYGWAARNDHYLLKTINGGDYWTSINTFVGSEYRLNAVYFVNRLTGWAVGENRSYFPAGAIFKTTNGGANWFTQNSNFNYIINSIHMLNKYHGFASSWNKDSILETTNGGNNWLKKKIGGGQPVYKIWFKDTLNGWSIGTSEYISKTINGGNNWISNGIPSGNPTNFYFLNIFTGWITYRNGSAGSCIRKSTNGGVNWFLQYQDPGIWEEENAMEDVFFRNENTGWALKANGTVFKSTNSGTNWSKHINPPLGNIYSIHFSDFSTGWLASNYYDGFNIDGLIYKTSNSGVNWVSQYTSTSSALYALTFINNSTGYASSIGKICKTINGGINWIANNVMGTFYFSIFFNNNYTGWACGASGNIIKTTNSGGNWIYYPSNVYCNLNDIYFIDSLVGYIASDSGYVLKTTNGGENWSNTIPYGNNKKYRAIQFINSNTGFVIGNRNYSVGFYPYSKRLLLKTTNAGLSWEPKIDITQEGTYYFNDLFFINVNTGWIISSNSEIRKTTNSGEDWFFEPSPINESFNCMHFINEDAGWIGGNRGTVLTTNPLVGINTHQNEIPQKYYLKQNYPNPFNPITKIRYDLVKNEHVVLKIYDILGREITSLINEKQNAGSYEVEWNASGFPSGVYFYRLETKDFSEVRKMLLLK